MFDIRKNFPVSDRQVRAIRAIPYFAESQYRDLDIEKTLSHFRDRYVLNAPIKPAELAGKLVADVGCGYGWLAMSYAIWTDAQVVAIELNDQRLAAARQIAQILGIDEKIAWRVGSVTLIPMADREATILYCIEVIEHIQRDLHALKEIQRVADQYIVLTTPNLFSPIIGHDTRLPFCHWLPPALRRIYATAFRRQHMNENNLFWSPLALSRALDRFSRVSRFLHYQSFDDYLATFPYYSPYGKGNMKYKIKLSNYLYLRGMSLLGPFSYLLMHNLAGTFRRECD